MDVPSPPVFVFSDDVASFDSVEPMLSYIEPVDIAEAALPALVDAVHPWTRAK